jgi:hypothetical protein
VNNPLVTAMANNSFSGTFEITLTNNLTMILKQSIQQVFVQLSQTLNELNNDEYRQPSKVLLNATIGEHVRHIIELFQCLEAGYHTGIVNYEKRKRDHDIENNRELASSLLKEIYQNIDRSNKDILLEAEYYCDPVEIVSISSNYYRELAYNLEHTIHHMALIRVGINEVSAVRLPEEFGVAYSTVKYRQQCAQ